MLRRVAGRDVRALGDVRADGEERGVEAALAASSSRMFGDLAVELELDAQVEDALHLGVEHVARQPVLRDAEAHHAAGQRAGLDDRHRVAEPAQVIGGRQPGRPGADDQHALAGLGCAAASNCQPRLIASSPRKRSTELMPTASSSLPRLQARLAGVIADAPHDRGERIVLRSARATRLRSRRSRRGTASPGCPRRPGRRGCTAAGGRRRPAAACARSRSCWRGSSRRRA